MKTSLSKIPLSVCLLLSILLSACGAAETPPALPTATASPANTATSTPEPTLTLTPTATLTPTLTPSPTSTPDIAATQKSESLQTWVAQLAGEKVIPSTEGKYVPLDDFSMEFAKIGYFTWSFYEGVESVNFVMQARVRITNESTENAFKSACGLYFQDDFSEGHAVFFSLDGNANYRTGGGDRGSNYLDASLLQDPEGVTLTLILSNKSMTFYVNDRKALSGITVYGGPFTVGTTILSSTSDGFGTRCDFTEVAVWEMD